MRDLLHLGALREGKVLLAYSGGADSTALFHLLLEHGIDFDIAHVNYHTRPASDDEAEAAESKARSYSLVCHTHSAPPFGSDFERRAREERYRFFGHLMETYGYRYLLTAHQLNDRLEWMLMQLCRGAGLPEMLGIRSMDERDGIRILRPLLEWDRQAIETYLHERSIAWSEDESNADDRYTRNRFRHRMAAPLMREYSDAIRRSFRYLEEDADALIEPMTFRCIGGLCYAPLPAGRRSLVAGIDRQLKSMGHLLRSGEKEQLKHADTLVVGRRYVIACEGGYAFIAPYRANGMMGKEFREECRTLGIHPKLRGYLGESEEGWEAMRRLRGAPAPLRSG